jgi:hypothetical protein
MVQDDVRRTVEWRCGGYVTHRVGENSMPAPGLKDVCRIHAYY